MKEIIGSLADIDAQAAEILASIQGEKAALAKTYAAKAEAVEAEIAQSTKAALDRLKANLEDEIKEDIQKVQTQAANNLKDLDQNYTVNHDKYVQQIFEQIIEV